jgi:hypothetical protein
MKKTLTLNGKTYVKVTKAEILRKAAKKAGMLVAGALMFAPGAEARLDDTLEECQARYGEGRAAGLLPEDIAAGGTSAHQFRTHEHDVTAVFVGGRCVSILFVANGGETELGGETVRKLMDENGGEEAWEEDSEMSIVTHVSPDKKRVAVIGKGDAGFYEASHWEKLYRAITKRN